jgi:drug/metabolite transporter (DMT)-like permease
MLFHVMALGWGFITIQFAASGRVAEIARLSPAGWAAVGFLGLVCSGLAYAFWYQGLEVLPAARAGAFLYLEPLATMVVAPAVLGESLGPSALAGGALILAGVWIVNRRVRPALDS